MWVIAAPPAINLPWQPFMLFFFFALWLYRHFKGPPEAVMEHLGRGAALQHSWGQFVCGWGRARLHPSLIPFKGWEGQGQHLSLRNTAFGVCLALWDGVSDFFFLYFGAAISLFLWGILTALKGW